MQIDNSEINLSKELDKLKNEKKNYDNLKRDISFKEAQIDQKRNSLEIIEKPRNDISGNKFKKDKKNSFIDIFLTIITFGLYWFLVIKKRESNDKNDVKSFMIDSKQRKKLESEIIDLEKELLILKQKISTIPIVEINSKIENSKNESDQISKSTNKYNEIKKNLQLKEQESIDNDRELAIFEQKRSKIYEQINNTVKAYFKSFDIDLLNNDRAILIKQNGIEWKYLNNAAKQNIIFKLNEFLKKGINLKTFSLIDNGESINYLQIESDSQYIIAEVTKDNKLTLNDEEIY